MFRRKGVKIFNVPDWSDKTTKTYDLTTVEGREQVPINLDEIKDICFIYVRENNEYYRLISDTTSGTTRTLVFDGSKTITITKTSTAMTVVFSAGTSDIDVTDTTLTLSGVPADAKATGDAINEVKADLDAQADEITYNESVITDISDEEYTELSGTDTTGKTINYTKAVVDANNNFHIKIYSVNEGDGFRINGSTLKKGYYYIFTDGTNVLKASIENAEDSIQSIINAFDIAPSGATTLIVAYNVLSSYVDARVEKITGHTVAGLGELDVRIDKIEEITETRQASQAVQTSDITIYDSAYMYTSGAINAGVSQWQYGEYAIPSNAEKLIVTANAGQSARLWILKDANNIVVGYSEDSSSTTKKTEIVNLSLYPTATKVFVNDKKSGNLEIAYIYNKSVIDGENVYVNGQNLSSILGVGGNDKLYGKILCCVGDSITYGADMDAEGITNESNITVYNCDSNGNFTETSSGFLKTWGWQIASRHNMTFYNGGVSGSTMQGLSDRNGFSLENGRYTKLPDNIDYLLIWFGWNDSAYGSLGAITDITNESYYGGYNVVLPYLIDKYPFAKIGLIVPFGSSAGHREAVRLLGNKWGCAVWDNYQGGTPLYFGKEDSVGVSATIVTSNRAKFQANGAHPNFKGHRQLADMIEEWLRGI